MKTLILTRHAKSDWSNLHLQDFDRELNERGLGDAPRMGKRLKEKEIPLDLIISSTAKRAEQTSILLANAYGYAMEKIMWLEKLYHASLERIEEVIFDIPNNQLSAMIVCHNPGITHFVNSVAGFIMDDLPTCGMVAFGLETEEWKDFRQAKAHFLFYDFPKNGM